MKLLIPLLLLGTLVQAQNKHERLSALADSAMLSMYTKGYGISIVAPVLDTVPAIFLISDSTEEEGLLWTMRGYVVRKRLQGQWGYSIKMEGSYGYVYDPVKNLTLGYRPFPREMIIWQTRYLNK